jgi:hypothetical protein
MDKEKKSAEVEAADAVEAEVEAEGFEPGQIGPVIDAVSTGEIVLPGDKIMSLRFIFEGSETVFYLDETKPGKFLLRVWKFGA